MLSSLNSLTALPAHHETRYSPPTSLRFNRPGEKRRMTKTPGEPCRDRPAFLAARSRRVAALLRDAPAEDPSGNPSIPATACHTCAPQATTEPDSLAWSRARITARRAE